MLLRVIPVQGGCRFPVRVQPRASRDEVVGVQEETLRVRLTAPPVEGQANAALIEVLARWLGVRKSAVSIVVGDTSRSKWVEVKGVSVDDVRQKLAL